MRRYVNLTELDLDVLIKTRQTVLDRITWYRDYTGNVPMSLIERYDDLSVKIDTQLKKVA